LADIDSKLAAIRAQRAELAEGLREAARHLAGRTGSDCQRPERRNSRGRGCRVHA
jgi:hypothetical protein